MLLRPALRITHRAAERRACTSASGAANVLVAPIRALLLDVGGTLLQTSEDVSETYVRIAAAHGVSVSQADVRLGFKKGFGEWRGIKYVGDGRPFWRHVVATATGSRNDALFEALYGHYALPSAWVAAPGAAAGLARLRRAGVKLAVVSNFDTSLRPLLAGMGLDTLFDSVIVSAEVGAEKPDERIFRAALESVGVSPEEALHVGDDLINDERGARAVGCAALVWGRDVNDFDSLMKMAFPEAAAATAL